MNEGYDSENFNLRLLFNVRLLSLNSPPEHIFNLDKLCHATEDSFVPVINFQFSKIVNRVLIYPRLGIRLNFLSKELQKYLLNIIISRNSQPCYIKYKEAGEEKKIYIGYGFIMDEDFNFLFLASFRGHFSGSITKRDVKIFITSSFMNQYKRFYNLLMREFLQDYIDSGCALSIMDSDLITDSVYKNKFERDSNFLSMEDKMSFIEEFRNTILEYEQ